MDDDPDAHPGTLAARAFDRALGAEREAQTAIADCAQRCAQLVERARQQRRVILERAQARAVALHSRAAQALQLRSTAILQKRRQSAEEAVERLSESSRRTSALQRLTERLTTDASEHDRDGA